MCVPLGTRRGGNVPWGELNACTGDTCMGQGMRDTALLWGRGTGGGFSLSTPQWNPPHPLRGVYFRLETRRLLNRTTSLICRWGIFNMQIETALAGRQRWVSVAPHVHPKVGDRTGWGDDVHPCGGDGVSMTTRSQSRAGSGWGVLGGGGGGYRQQL